MSSLWHARFYIRHWLMSRRLAAFGEGSRIDKPELLVGTEGLHIGNHVRVWPHSRIECIRVSGHRGEIHIGSGTSAQLYFHCGAAARVCIGENVLIAGRVYISDHDHAWPAGGEALVVAPVSIGDRCWLGEGSAVLKGVSLGAGCVVGANAVVTKSAPPGCMLVGVPARIVKRFDAVTQTWQPCTEGWQSQHTTSPLQT